MLPTKKSVNCNGTCLPDSMSPVHSLQCQCMNLLMFIFLSLYIHTYIQCMNHMNLEVNERIPVVLHEYNRVCGAQVQSQSTSSRRHQQNPRHARVRSRFRTTGDPFRIKFCCDFRPLLRRVTPTYIHTYIHTYITNP